MHAVADMLNGRATSYELRATSYELRATSYELRDDNILYAYDG